MAFRVAILASGSGTTAESFIRACAGGQVDCTVELVIASKPTAGIVSRINNLNHELGLEIECLVIGRSTHPPHRSEQLALGDQTEAEESALLDVLSARTPDVIALMGYMKHIGPQLVERFGWLPTYDSIYQANMLNTHPGLLPETKGRWGEHVQEYVLSHALATSGQTLHLVAHDYDDGPSVAEHIVPVEPGDTAETLFRRVQAVEKATIAYDIEAFAQARANYLSEIEEE